MSTPQNVTSDEVLAALLNRPGGTPQSVTEDEIRVIRQKPRAISVEHDPDAGVYVVHLDEETPVRALQQNPSINDVRPIGPGANF